MRFRSMLVKCKEAFVTVYISIFIDHGLSHRNLMPDKTIKTCCAVRC